MLDLSQAVVVHPAQMSKTESKAVDMLLDEVEKRTRIRWRTAQTMPADGAIIAISRQASNVAEGYSIRVRQDGARGVVSVVGNDARGVLFGVGKLLRLLRLERDRVRVPANLDITTAPKYALRGHQLGYRPKTNSYDGWSLPMWEQYIRDLTVFGCNAVELIPPRSDDAADSPHFPLPPMQMMEAMSRLLDEYGMDVWIWYPALDPDYADPKWVEFALKEWGEVFKRLPRIDALFVPGGDPGHTQPKYLMALLEKQAQNLRRFHPKAQVWVAPQGFSQAWLDEFIQILQGEPAWLTGVVFGPQVRVSLAKLRELVPARYPIRHYPDITHSRQCQFPVPDWDWAYSLTEARECINPRPRGMARIFRLLQPHTIGFLTYSEGCNDDVNKAIWSALGWDPDADIVEVLREYSRYFIGERYTDTFAQGLLALERNWQGPLLTNAHVDTTLAQFQAMERAAAPQDKLNWRFQQALYRAYYDAYTRRRLLYETALEEQAMDKLRAARHTGSLGAMAEAEAILDRAVTQQVAPDLRARVFELAEALFQSVRMQLSVERYQAIDVGRGANLDTVDLPLNNRLWLKARFAEIRALSSESDRLREIDAIVNWTNPGPGGFYDDLGNLSRQPHLVVGKGFHDDPDFRESALVGFAYLPTAPTSWWTHAQSLYDAPLQMRYTHLDPTAQYRLRVVYAGDSPRLKIRCVANDAIEIHPLIEKPSPIRPLEFDIPPEATRGGTLLLSWYREPGLGGNGRGCQVAEVWLIRK
ncbi:MAG: hypothetical protein NZT92_15000 [Abditibacteriales bacterium]|nr:hypothetical protein [Abditibacteriales bacterium]MDW8367084.1 glycoside hydrolase family 20 zincin-like fold domain-containing protein [Abditibacteriales bacterium]